MIKKTTIDILKNGVNFKHEGYCYRVTAENYKFWDDYTNHCLAIKVIKNDYFSMVCKIVILSNYPLRWKRLNIIVKQIIYK